MRSLQPSSIAENPLALTPKQAAPLLGISARKLWSMTASGEIPHVRFGRAVRYPRAALERWLNERAEQQAT